MTDPAELAAEQDYFDAALAERDRQLESLDLAALQAADTKAGHALHENAKRARLAVSQDDAVAFGRFDLDGERLYIGKRSVLNEDKDALVINWQSPAAIPFYRATANEPGGVTRKRTFEAKRNRIEDWQDLVFADLLEELERFDEAEYVRKDDSVMAALNSSRDDSMRDIAATIQAAQDTLIRHPLESLLVIQGGPGTGKTAVALHRVSWLLFNEPTLTTAEVLVVGPNATFGRYISRVLPDLGDHGVDHRHLKALGPAPSTGTAELVSLASLKAENRMAGLLERGLRARIRVPEGFRAADLAMDDDQLEAIVADLRQEFPATPYMTARNQLRAVIQRPLEARSGGSAPANVVDAILERLWPSLSPAQFLRELLGSRERLLEAAGDVFTAAEVQALYRQAADRVSEERWTDADVPLLDEAHALLVGAPQRYRHIVVDEAQDLTPMQLRSLRRRSLDGSMTLVGDIAQSTAPGACDDWWDVVASLKQKYPGTVETLKIGYRVPQEVMALAAQLLPRIAPHVEPPRVVRSVGPPDLVFDDSGDLVRVAVSKAQSYAARGLFVGIIAPLGRWAELAEVMRARDVKWADGLDGELAPSGINIVDPATAKGLEFEAVVVVDPVGIARTDKGLRLLYIALTRTTKHLAVVHEGLAGTGLEEAGMPSEASASAGTPTIPTQSIGEGHESDVKASSREVTAMGGRDASVTSAPTTAAAEPAASRTEADRWRRELVTTPLQSTVLMASAAELAAQVKASVAPELWPILIDTIRRELQVSADDLLEFLD
ncbi:UvrD-helicase domain-containing protein [Kineosporia sp. R_H_3]|uniref:HelD family protein n=1 Tax=Kineosporia sp. R_H_3 TaxID=1961848 RepID=UPI0013040F8B|nr:UvrD-helicase domain-containing protein [Kineosporia sp. R_H_3]